MKLKTNIPTITLCDDTKAALISISEQHSWLYIYHCRSPFSPTLHLWPSRFVQPSSGHFLHRGQAASQAPHIGVTATMDPVKTDVSHVDMGAE